MKLALVFIRQLSLGLCVGSALAGSGFYTLMFLFVFFIMWTAT